MKLTLSKKLTIWKVIAIVTWHISQDVTSLSHENDSQSINNGAIPLYPACKLKKNIVS